jgi:hypothetical protein
MTAYLCQSNKYLTYYSYNAEQNIINTGWKNARLNIDKL